MSNEPFADQPAESAPGWGHDPMPGAAVRAASVGKRVGAFIIDGIILGIVNIVLLAVTGMNRRIFEATLAGESPTGLLLLSAVIGTALFLAYFVLQEGSSGQTLAKRMLGIKVVAADGSPTDMAGAFKRRLPFLVNLVPRFGLLLLFVAELGILITAIQDEAEHRGFHDKWGDTKVIEV
jgi:uncharacterized RDD family membrane protein YckC